MEQYLLQISSGRGPKECERAVVLVFKEFLNYFKQHHISIQLMNEDDCNLKTATSIVIKIEQQIDRIRNDWEGCIKWISVSPYRPNHKRKNWFVQVSLNKINSLPKLDEQSIKYETFRSSGPGGQNVNKVESAVRAIHIPTGIQAVSMESRSQLENKKNSLMKLKMLFQIAEENAQAHSNQALWQQKIDIERGNAIKTFNKPL